MGTKPKTHIIDPGRAAVGNATFSMCGVFLYRPAMVDNANPSCQRCINYRQSRRSKDRPETTKAR